MAGDRPIFFIVHGDDGVREALAGELRRRFDADYQVLGERSPAAALRALERLAAAPEPPVALLIAPESLPEGAGGVDFLVAAHELHPAARRVLLIGRGEWSAAHPAHPAQQAMTLGQIDGYLFVPWASTERWLYLPVTEFLAEWAKSRPPEAEVIRVVGDQWEARSHRLREILTRTGIPYGFYPARSDAGRRLLRDSGQDGTRLPVLATETGIVLVDPTFAQIAEALGFRTRPRPGGERCDLAIVGAGPAGLAAAVYAASEGLRTLLVEPLVAGGQAGTSSLIRNYLGFPRGLSGEDLTNNAVEQAWLFGADLILAQEATGLRVRGPDRLVRLSGGDEIAATAVLVATGVTWRRLGIPRLEALVGAGVFYGAAGAEAAAVAGRPVFVVGGGNSAGQAAVHLSRQAASVTMLVRGEALSAGMSDYLVRQLQATPNIEVRTRSVIVDGVGGRRLEALRLRDGASGATEEVPAAALFVMIGAEPRTGWLDGVVERDDHGYVLTGHDLLRGGAPPPGWPLRRPPLYLETSVPGVFAAGDVRHRSVKRVASAVGAGAIAVQLVHEYLNEPDG